ncbi:MAG TPA: RagB/SusD family nutrient uptake outer membrane protein [Bacteroidetes bacterium]|nr:RagB/SusD family nutrient uptake outer membrane protein [Bacteroidota bacterium]
MKKIIYTLFTIALLAGVLTSCSKEALDPTLAQAKAVEGSITKVEDIKGLLYGAYNRMTGSGYYGRDFIIWGEVRSDNCFSNGNSGRFVADARMDYTTNFGGHWAEAYSVIAIANIIININPDEIEGDADQLEHYIGQAYALRALCHYDLLIYYGQMHNGDAAGLGIPYIKEYKSEDIAPVRDTWQNNLNDIYADIDMAISMMDPALDDDSKELFTYYGAHALKVRVATYFGDWSDVVSSAEIIIASGNYSIVPGAGFANSFLVDGDVNSIFELAFSSVDNANINGLQYIYRGTSYGDVQALEDLYLAFDPGDVRAAADMIGPDPDVPTRDYCNLGKYPSYDYSDNVPVLRYEEVILSYAEALWRINPADANALTQLNLVPAERNALLYTEVNEDNILKERRREFCFEGLRFHDLARTGRDIPYVDTFNQTHEGPAYGTYKFAFPIPLGEMDANPNMVQNRGYI